MVVLVESDRRSYDDVSVSLGDDQDVVSKEWGLRLVDSTNVVDRR